ncbi:MAG: hypothetical protein RLZ03_1880 [Pseudomonadota bacterium]
MKNVSQLDADGYFVGVTVADESPLEPGVFLIPAGAVDAEPPAIPEGQRARWNNGWALEAIPQPDPEPDPEPEPPRVPSQVTRAQGKVVLIQMGLWPQVVAFVDAIEDPVQKAIAEVAVYETLHWQRTSPFLNQVADALGITQEQMDELFIEASRVVL